MRKFFPSCPLSYRGNKTISKMTPLRKEILFPQFNVASYKRPGNRLSFEYTTTLLSREGGDQRTGTATMFRKIFAKYTIFSTVLSKIVEQEIKTKGDQFRWKKNKHFTAVVKKKEMLGATKVEMSGSEKKNERKHIQHFLHKTCN